MQAHCLLTLVATGGALHTTSSINSLMRLRPVYSIRVPVASLSFYPALPRTKYAAAVIQTGEVPISQA